MARAVDLRMDIVQYVRADELAPTLQQLAELQHAIRSVTGLPVIEFRMGWDKFREMISHVTAEYADAVEGRRAPLNIVQDDGSYRVNGVTVKLLHEGPDNALVALIKTESHAMEAPFDSNAE